jgi:RHS repeat-associated protein
VSGLVTLPTGGGALRGVGESFSPDLHMGTGAFLVPIALPRGRNGFNPELELAYSSGHGASSFGLGWELSVSSIRIRTDKRVPHYDLRDVFLLAGAEDLVPIAGSGAVTAYRPRTDTEFARIERHQSAVDYWSVRTIDGTTTLYGAHTSAGGAVQGAPDAVVLNPLNGRPFAWHVAEMRDQFGNRIEFSYELDAPEDSTRRARDLENGRSWSQRLLRQIRYIDFDDGPQTRFLVSVTFTYDDRPDPSSDYRPGFELRSTRRCKQILIETHASATRPQPVRAYEFVYLDERKDLGDPALVTPPNGASLLSQVQVVGYSDNTQTAEGAPQRELPPLEFGYTTFEPRGRSFEPVAGSLPPRSLADPHLELIDLTGDGLPDMIEMNGVARWWRNVGGHFDPPRPIALAPASLRLGDGTTQLFDADGDGRVDLLSEEAGGYFPMRFEGTWDPRSLRRYDSFPTVRLDDPEVRFVDLDGDGLTDVLRSGPSFECFFNAASRHEAWRVERHVPRRALDAFPNVRFSDPRVRLADMTGDNLADVVLVHAGSVTYWPSQGRGSFAHRVLMEQSPRFPIDVDPRRVLLADVDGDGLADLIYVEDRQVTIWINQGGERWSDPLVVRGTPSVANESDVRLADVNGTGMAGILWSSDVGSRRRGQQFRFLDLTGGVKPYLLNAMDNNIGAVTRVEYKPSTYYSRADAKQRSMRWRTPLPGPLHVVARVEAIDQVSGNKRTTEFSYHNGYWDGHDRELRGFARVDQRDTETFADFHAPGLHPGVAFSAPKSFSPPVKTRTWFHVGAVDTGSGEWGELDLSHEYWSGDTPLLERPTSTALLLRSLPPAPRRDALRALRGSVLRTETFALDGDRNEHRPYTVTESVYGVVEASAPAQDPLGPLRSMPLPQPRVFVTHLRSSRTTQWERGDDPMSTISFLEDYDEFGRVRDEIVVALPRRSKTRLNFQAALIGAVAPDETNVLATLTRTMYAGPAPEFPNLYLHDRIEHVVAFDLQNAPAVNETAPDDLVMVLRDQARVAVGVRSTFLQALGGWSVGSVPVGLRLVGHTRNRYDGFPHQGRADGKVGPRGAMTRSETLYLTERTLVSAYGSRRPAYLGGAAQTPAGAPTAFGASIGYRLRTATPGAYFDGYYCDTKSNRFDARGSTVAVRDALGSERRITLDRFDLFPEAVIDDAGLQTNVINNYRVFEATRTTDPNGTSTIHQYTPLGLVDRMWLEGQSGEGGSESRPESRFEYFLRAFEQSRTSARPQPIYVASIQRVHHYSAGVSNAVAESREFSDGFGRLVQTRALAEPITVSDLGLPLSWGTPTTEPTSDVDSARVIVSGWKLRDNKGRVVEQYEPFFAQGWAYQPEVEARQGVATTMHYDARGEVVRTVAPDGAEERVVRGVPASLSDPELLRPTPWETYVFDANDLDALRTTAYAAETTTRADSAHHGTPASRVLDGLGRVICHVERNGSVASDCYATRTAYDLRGNVTSVTDPLGRVAFRHIYDAQNRSLRVETIDGGIRTSVHDGVGNLVEYRDSKGAVVLREYDRLNRPLGIWARDNSAGSLTLRESLTYGDGGDPAQSVASRSANRQLNRLGRVSVHRDEAGLVEFARYDFKGNVVEKTRRVVSDAALAQGWFADWSAANADSALDTDAHRTNAKYDAFDRQIELRLPREARLRPGATQRARGVVTMSYNRGGLLERVALDGVAYIEEIVYNARGQRVLVAYGNGLLGRYAHDPTSYRLARLRTERFVRRAAGHSWVPNGLPLQDSVYTYDPAGNVVELEERTPGCGIRGTAAGPNRLARRFTYDPLYRLLSATGRSCQGAGPSWPLDDVSGCGAYAAPYQGGPPTPNQDNGPDLTEAYTETYGYDPAGNLLQLTRAAGGSSAIRRFGIGGLPPAQWANAANNRVTSLQRGGSTHSYAFDANGNVRQQNLERFHGWDHADRMTAYRVQAGATPSLRARYLYGADGMRVKKWVQRGAGQTDSTVYVDGSFELLSWREAGAPKYANVLHVTDGGTRVALVRVGDPHAQDAGPPVQFHLCDHLGTSAVVVSDDGQWISREEYFSGGETSFGGFARKRYRFIGKERDEESSLYYFGARYLAPWLGRWISADPAGTIDGVNLYAYVRNTPLSASDPVGLASSKKPKAGNVGIGANDPKTIFEDAARHAAFDAGKKLETGKLKATGGGKELPPPKGEKYLKKLLPKTKAAHNLRVNYAGAQGVEVSKVTMEIVEAGSETKMYGKASQRIVPEPTVKGGEILSVAKEPGGAPKGARNPDALITKEPIPPKKWDSLVGENAKAVGEKTLDTKAGGGRTTDKPGLIKESGGLPHEDVRPFSTTSAAGGRLKSLGKVAGGTAKAIAPMVATEAWGYFREQTMDEVCRIKNKAAGTVTPEEIQWMEDVGYVNTGVDDSSHRLTYEKTFDRKIVDLAWNLLHVPDIVIRSMQYQSPIV